MKPPEDKSFLAHLSDLRRCLIRALIGLLLGFAFSLFLSRELLDTVIAPVAGRLIFIRPAEVFMGHLKLALLNGVAISLPITLWQAGVFLWPALYAHERRALLLHLPFAFALFAAGLAFGYFVVVRIGFDFLLSLAPSKIKAQITLDNYLSFVLAGTIGCGVVFMLPVIVLILTRIGVLSAGFLWRQQRYAVVGLMLLVALITPTTDAVSMLLVFAPLFLLFELSILLAALAERRRKKQAGQREGGGCVTGPFSHRF